MVVVKKIIKIVISLVLLWLLFKRLQWVEFLSIIKEIKAVWVIPVLLLGPIGILLLALRWRLFLLKLGISLPLTQAARGVWTGSFFNMFLPGSTGGDFYRLVFVRTLFPKSESKITSSLVLDRLFGVGSLLFLGLIGVTYKKHMLVQMLSVAGTINSSKVVFIGTVLVISLGSCVYIIKSANETSLLGKGRVFIKAMVLQISSELSDPELVVKAFGLALGMHLISFCTGYFISKALGINMGYIDLALFTTASALIMALPISINGVGVRELLLVGFFQFNGFSCGHGIGIKESAIAYSFFGVLCDLIRVAPGGVWFALAKETKTIQPYQSKS